MVIYIGCGSWWDDEYVGVFYFKKLFEKKWLLFYMKWFDCVEFNVIYYVLLKVEYV